jgi:hypothetical protein
MGNWWLLEHGGSSGYPATPGSSGERPDTASVGLKETSGCVGARSISIKDPWQLLSHNHGAGA